MPRKSKQEDAEEAEDLVRYELGYHLVPLITEEGLPAEVGTIREAIEGQGGVVTADEFPTARSLAYPMSQMVAGKRQTFVQSYFGWIRFELAPSAVENLKHALESNSRILRFLIIRTKREVPAASRTASIIQPAEPVATDGAVSAPGPAAEPALSDEEIDKTIEELISQ